VADAAEALVGAVGSRANHEHILQTCIRLQPSAFPSSITWSNLADSSPLKHDNLELRATKVATVGQVVGYQFNQSSLLNLVLVSLMGLVQWRAAYSFSSNDSEGTPLLRTQEPGLESCFLVKLSLNTVSQSIFPSCRIEVDDLTCTYSINELSD
jgi:hypothetical protein